MTYWPLISDLSPHPGPFVCATCQDSLSEGSVLSVDVLQRLARVFVDGEEREVDVAFVGDVAPGSKVLCHGGTALRAVSVAGGESNA